jgi:hypothetical protein
MSLKEMLLLAAAGGWVVAALCFWALHLYENRNAALHDMELESLRTLLDQIRDELKARTSLSDARSSVDREVEKLYDDTKE